MSYYFWLGQEADDTEYTVAPGAYFLWLGDAEDDGFITIYAS